MEDERGASASAVRQLGRDAAFARAGKELGERTPYHGWVGVDDSDDLAAAAGGGGPRDGATEPAEAPDHGPYHASSARLASAADQRVGVNSRIAWVSSPLRRNGSVASKDSSSARATPRASMKPPVGGVSRPERTNTWRS